MMANNVNCPNCGHGFDPGGALAADIEKKYKEQYQRDLQQSQLQMEESRKKLEADKQLFEERKKNENELFLQKMEKEKIKMEADVQERLQKSIASDFENRLRMMQQEKDDNAEKLKEARKKELEFLQQVQALKNKEEELEIDLQKKLQEERQVIGEEIRRREADKNALKDNEQALHVRELEMKLEAQKKLVEEMKRKADQGSMQLQGEVQELALEEMLGAAFPFDLISEVGKGVRGADCIQTVRNHLGQECGKIIYESKRTEAFTADWIEKLKKDMLATGADIAVIVTKTMPKDLQQFGERNGVYICTFLEVKSLAVVLRNAILKISDTRKSQENKGEKMVAMYHYLTSHEFIGNMNAMREGFRSLRAMMQKEKEDFEKNWKKKEKHIEMIIQNSIHISGSVEGIAGQDLINMQLLDADEEI